MPEQGVFQERTVEGILSIEEVPGNVNVAVNGEEISNCHEILVSHFMMWRDADPARSGNNRSMGAIKLCPVEVVLSQSASTVQFANWVGHGHMATARVIMLRRAGVGLEKAMELKLTHAAVKYFKNHVRRDEVEKRAELAANLAERVCASEPSENPFKMVMNGSGVASSRGGRHIVLGLIFQNIEVLYYASDVEGTASGQEAGMFDLKTSMGGGG